MLPVPALLIGGDERVRGSNGPFRALFGSSAAGRHYITVLRQPAILDAVEHVLQGGGSRTARYFSTDAQRDTTWRTSVSGVEIEGRANVLISFEDVTALEEAGKMRRDFVANVSHELRTPLTALTGFIETLKGAAREDPAARDRFLAIMETEAGRMARLVDDLLSLSRVEDDERVRPTETVDLTMLIGETIETLTPVAEQRGARIVARLPDAPLIVPGDPGQIRQVLMNLIENGLKYGRDGGEVRVRLHPPEIEPVLRGSGVRIDVEDDGEGIEAHHIARLTERFYRVDAHRSREIGGTGLGLAIVKHIVNRHRGRLRITSQPGQGSRFSVVLPTE